MTFYSIIFGLLFVCACKELLQTLLQREWQKFFQASSLALLIFNDALYTSHEIEQLHIVYTIQMKFVDLLDFFLLALAIVVLDPMNNALGVKARLLAKKNEELLFWYLLTSYWVFTLLWNWLAGLDLTKVYVAVQYPLLLPFLAMCILAKWWPSSWLTNQVRRWVPALLLLYIGIFKLYFYGHGFKGFK